MSKKLIVANWKMQPETLADAEEILAHIDEWLAGVSTKILSEHGPDITICPPFLFLEEVAQRLQEGRLAACATLGAQDIAASDAPGQTGEVSGAQLKALGVRSVLVGHSERRTKFHETDDIVHAKLLAALQYNLVPILCVGELSREEGWENELAAQVRSGLAGLDGPDLARVLLAYEPVWAISTNPGAHPDTPESAVVAAGVVRAAAGDMSPLLYGGSITSRNAADFLSQPSFDGVLVGGASVRAEEFTRILQAVI